MLQYIAQYIIISYDLYKINHMIKRTDSEVIGEGAYGCIHNPSLRCEKTPTTIDTNYTNKVSKVMEKKNADKELDTYSIIANIDKPNNYYLGKPIECKPIDNTETKDSIKKCEKHGEELWKKFKDLSLLIMENGGDNLEMYSTKIHKWKKTKENKRKVEEFLLEFHRVISGIFLFSKKGILHFDMKPQNIVFDDAKIRMNIIDFGLTNKLQILINNSKKSINGFAKYHWSFPFEFYFVNKNAYDDFIQSTDSTKNKYFDNLLKDILDTTVKTPEIIGFRYFYSYIFEEDDNMQTRVKNHFIEFKKTMLNMSTDTYDFFIKKSLNSVDVYGLGMTVLYVLHKVKTFLNTSLYNDLVRLSNKAVTADFINRITIDDFLYEFETIFEISHSLM